MDLGMQRSLGSDVETTPCICATNAFRFLLRDLGNGVDRIEMYELIGLEEAKTESTLPGRVKMPIPAPDKITDLCNVATEAGLCRLCRGCVPTAFSRAIDERSIEVIIWRSP